MMHSNVTIKNNLFPLRLCFSVHFEGGNDF